ncbi:hypothetical protein WT54_27565 [Burkholderia territorii]|nr:hypothetical protein WT54_27565 [Burkholderia territorii]
MYQLCSLSIRNIQCADLLGKFVRVIENINVDNARRTYSEIPIQRRNSRDRLLIIRADEVNISIWVHLAKDRLVETSVGIRLYYNGRRGEKSVDDAMRS